MDCSRYTSNFAVLVIVLLLTTNVAVASEGKNIPLHKAPVISIKTGGASNLSKSYIPKEQKTDNKALTNITQKKELSKKGQSPFMAGLFNMFKALFKVLAIIGIFAGGILLYRWIKNKYLLAKAQQQAAPQPQNEVKEPENISEAVASFVKLRIKR